MRKLFQLWSPPCSLDSPENLVQFPFHGHSAAVIQQPMSAEDMVPALKRHHIIQLSGIGVQFNCAMNRMSFIAETFYNGLDYAIVWSIDYNNQSTIQDVIQALVDLQDSIQKADPESPIFGIGHSMGTSLVVQLATQRQLDGIVLLNAFEKPSDFLEFSRWETFAQSVLGYNLNTSESLDKVLIGSHLMPLIVFTNSEDQIIQSYHGSRLADKASQNQKFTVMHITYPGNHSNYLHDDVFIPVWNFIRKQSF